MPVSPVPATAKIRINKHSPDLAISVRNMTYKNLLLHMEPGDAAAGRLNLACGLAERLGAVLIGIDAAMLQVPVIDPTGFAAVDADLISSERQAFEAEFEDSAKRFDAAASAKNLRMKWFSSLEFPADMLCRHARAADLLVIGHGATAETPSPQHAADPGDVVMRAGRPALVVPPGISELRLAHVVVAWKDTREARRAVADSIPLMKLAGKTSIVAVSAEGETDEARRSAEDVVAYLGRHDIAAEAEVRIDTREGAAAEILKAAQEKQSDLVVCGAYGHARMREWAFGGVTRDLLKKSAVACLMSH